MFNLSNSQWHIDRNKKHYEWGFKPMSFHPLDHQEMTEFRTSAFAVTVFRSLTKDEKIKAFRKAYKLKEHKTLTEQEYITTRINRTRGGGYRSSATLIGLEDSGYVDIDEALPNSAGILPTQENVSKALQDKGIFNIVFRSGSNNPHKLRVLYKRGFKLYYKDSYNPDTDEWVLDMAHTSKLPEILSTNPKAFSTKQSLSKAINTVLYQEMLVIGKILADRGINTSGIDPTSCNPTMHSAHCIRPDNGYYPEPTMYLDGGVI